MGSKVNFALAVLNGAVGDYLARTANGLAIEMAFIHEGQPLALDAASLRCAFPHATSRVVILVHGLMDQESTWTMPDGNDYGRLFQRELGWTPLYLRYNSGRAIADNGAALAGLLDTLLANWPTPVEELILLGHSMGGLVLRSACHVASERSLPWLSKVQRAFYVGTPHLGAPTERVGRVVAKVLQRIENPYTQLAAKLAELRSDGVKDLGDADLRHEDRARRESRLSLRDARHPVPLLPSIQHYLVASAYWSEPWLASLFGDTVVPMGSSTDGACVNAATMALPPAHVHIVNGIFHAEMTRRPEIYEQLRKWCGEGS
jgi:pimeloyl-ACP methyl ester carboxylesterase